MEKKKQEPNTRDPLKKIESSLTAGGFIVDLFGGDVG